MTPEQKKRYRDRAMRAQRALAAEKAKYGEVDDGSGKRYRVGVYFLLAGELQRAAAAFDAFEEEFPDDGGEPVFHLYGTLVAFRTGDLATARARLREAALSNLYLVPRLIGEEFHAPGIWHASNREAPAYLDEIEEFLGEPTGEERRWMAAAWRSTAYAELREQYLATFGALHGERNLVRRTNILAVWRHWQARWFGRSR